jgi:hypothetical protein
MQIHHKKSGGFFVVELKLGGFTLVESRRFCVSTAVAVELSGGITKL